MISTHIENKPDKTDTEAHACLLNVKLEPTVY